MTQPQSVTVNRTLVGAIALVLFVAAGLLSLTGSDSQQLWSGACLKVGLVMGAIWLALPSLTRSASLGHASRTALLVVLAAALIISRTKVPLPLVIPAVAVAIVLAKLNRPRRPPSGHP